MMSPFGAFLDPVADKVRYCFFRRRHNSSQTNYCNAILLLRYQLMVATAMIMLTSLYPSLFFVVPVTLIMCREIAVSALREWMAEKGLRAVVKVGVLGKLKTTLQMVATVLLLLVFPGESADVDICALLNWEKPTIFVAGLSALYLATAAALYSGYQYFSAALTQLKRS